MDVMPRDVVTDPRVVPSAERSVDERAKELLGRMSLDEKIAQLGSVWSFHLTDGDRCEIDPHTRRPVFRRADGTLIPPTGLHQRWRPPDAPPAWVTAA